MRANGRNAAAARKERRTSMDSLSIGHAKKLSYFKTSFKPQMT
jgi:hypothetical protein